MKVMAEKHNKVSKYLELVQSQGRYWITNPVTSTATTMRQTLALIKTTSCLFGQRRSGLSGMG